MGTFTVRYDWQVEQELLRMVRQMGATEVTMRRSEVEEWPWHIMTVSGPQIPHREGHCHVVVHHEWIEETCTLQWRIEAVPNG